MAAATDLAASRRRIKRDWPEPHHRHYGGVPEVDTPTDWYGCYHAWDDLLSGLLLALKIPRPNSKEVVDYYHAGLTPREAAALLLGGEASAGGEKMVSAGLWGPRPTA
jgi:hypothetical protein